MVLNGSKRRVCFLFGAAGEAIWTCSACCNGQYDLASICGLFVVVAVINFFRWGRDVEQSGKGEK